MFRRLILRCLCLLQLSRLMRFASRKRVIILMYHGFTKRENHRGIENQEGNHLNIDRFREHIRYLTAHHEVIPLQQVVDARLEGTELPDYSVVVTMDDGYKSNYSLAYPILKQHNAPATIFLATGFVEDKEPLWPDRLEWALGTAEPGVFELRIGNESIELDLRDVESRRRTANAVREKLKEIPQETRLDILERLEDRLKRSLSTCDPMPDLYQALDWEDVLEMSRSGLVCFGNHAHTHVILAKCSPERQRQEVEISTRIIENRTGGRTPLFCYPNGGRGDFDAVTQSVLREHGYTCALTTIPGSNGPEANLFELRRFAVNDRLSFEEFLVILYGGLRNMVAELKAVFSRAPSDPSGNAHLQQMDSQEPSTRRSRPGPRVSGPARQPFTVSNNHDDPDS
ncbi:MAG: polysaccharide deacetylase family protein [Candidatus Krumholzibacteriia bacterium]